MGETFDADVHDVELNAAVDSVVVRDSNQSDGGSVDEAPIIWTFEQGMFSEIGVQAGYDNATMELVYGVQNSPRIGDSFDLDVNYLEGGEMDEMDDELSMVLWTPTEPTTVVIQGPKMTSRFAFATEE